MHKKLRGADVVIEILDARAPRSTRNPDFDDLFCHTPRVVVLNKEDLADPAATTGWVQYEREQGHAAVSFCAIRTGRHKALLQAVNDAAKQTGDKLAKRGVNKPVRAMVAGIPNVGKSSVINVLCGGKRAKVGAKPGVTRGQQWVRISPRLELLDTPGVLWPKFEDEQTARHLAFLGAIRDEILEPVELAQHLIDSLQSVNPGALRRRYKLDGVDQDAHHVLSSIAKKRGCMIKGGALDLRRAADILLNEFRQGKIGRITLERPQEGILNESKGDSEA